jgi:hypothetical protein
MSTEKHTCQGTAGTYRSFHRYTCGKTASLEHEGKWYCKRHHPPTIKAKDAARSAKWDAEWKAAQAAVKKAVESGPKVRIEGSAE